MGTSRNTCNLRRSTVTLLSAMAPPFGLPASPENNSAHLYISSQDYVIPINGLVYHLD